MSDHNDHGFSAAYHGVGLFAVYFEDCDFRSPFSGVKGIYTSLEEAAKGIEEYEKNRKRQGASFKLADSYLPEPHHHRKDRWLINGYEGEYKIVVRAVDTPASDNF